jgi:adenosylcobinamide-phosphate synthase
MLMTVATTLLVLAAALLIEAGVGYPEWLYRRIGHPVTWIGALIGWLDRELNHEGEDSTARRASGIVALAVILVVSALAAWIVERLLVPHRFGLIALAVVAATLIASRSLYDHVRDVAIALRADGLDGARRAVGRIVGRDPQSLDEHGVARAAIESLAENASDGVVAPVFWFALLGLPGLVAYKAINTADSMIGHRTPRHEDFGWASARLDDLVNLPASRLTGLLFTAAAAILPGASADSAFSAMRRDAAKHRSPNAGWPESAMAGALGLKLNGPKNYHGVLVADAYMGDGRTEATAEDILSALRLAAVAWAIMLLGLLVLALILRM